MKKLLTAILVILMVFSIAACGGSASSSGGDAADESKGTSQEGFGSSFYVENNGTAEFSEDAAPADAEDTGRSGISIGLPDSFIKDNVKLIYTADLYVQTLDFAESEKALYGLVEAAGGYFENISQDNGSYYASEDSYRYASYTVRVPSDKFRSFIESVSGGMHVVNMSQNAQDVGQMYFDTERRLETLKNKHDRLEKLLSEATNMTDIIELETALSDTEYQIEQYTSDLQRYDSLINYSTVYVSIEKVNEYVQGIEDELSFGERFLRSIRRGAANFGMWFEGLINWIGYYAIQLIILAVVIVLCVRFHVLKKIGGLFRGKKQERYVLIKKGDMEEEEKQ